MAQKGLPYVVPLGVAAALPDADHANSYLAVVGEHGYWLVDCADSPIGRLERAGLNPLDVRGIIITHFHPDHVYGLPAYILGLFLLASWKEKNFEWTAPLTIYAHPAVLPQVQAFLNVFATQSWFDLIPMAFQKIPPEMGASVAEDEAFTITATPAAHSVPSVALRFTDRATGRAFTYSSDTSPCAAVEALAQGSSLLFHEATDSDRGHTRPGAAGALAERAAVERLTLIHYYTQPEAMDYALAEARKTFSGDVTLAKAFTRYAW